MPNAQQVVLITGANSGFGRLIAETLARKNFCDGSARGSLSLRTGFARNRLRGDRAGRVCHAHHGKTREEKILTARPDTEKWRRFPKKIQSRIASSRANPQEIADAALQIIETPAGQRPLRYRVGPGGPGVQRINKLTDEVQVQLLEAFGVTALAKFKTRACGDG